MTFSAPISLAFCISILLATEGLHAHQTVEHTNAAALALTYTGIEYGAHGDLEFARLSLDRALNHMPYFARALLFLQICDDVRARQLSAHDAINIFKAMNHPAPPTTGPPADLARTVLKHHPEYGPAWIVLAKIESSRHPLEAATALDKAKKIAPQYYLAFYFSGLFLAKTNHAEAAIQDFSRAIKLDPSYAPSYLERGQLASARGQYDLAVKDFDLALQAWPKWGKRFKVFAAYLNEGIQEIENGEFRTALRLLNRAIKFNDKFGEAYLRRGIAHLNLKSYDDALADFQKAMEKDVTTAEVFYNRGVCYENKHDTAAALSNYAEAVALDSSQTDAHYRLGMLWSRAKRYKEAIQAFDAVIALDAGNHWAYYWCAVAHDRNNNYTAAARAYSLFLQVTPLASDSRYVLFARHRVKRLLRYALSLKQS